MSPRRDAHHPGAQRVGKIFRRRRRQFPCVGGALERCGQAMAQPLHVPLGQRLDARVAADRGLATGVLDISGEFTQYPRSGLAWRQLGANIPTATRYICFNTKKLDIVI
jgi:hypothetical protein